MNELTAILLQNTDSSYRDFFVPLVPDLEAETILGVRTPVLRKLAREYRGTETAEAFLRDLPHRYYEEVNLHLFLLSYEKDFAAYMQKLQEILPEVRSWASCDVIRNPILKKHTEELMPYISSWLASDHVYTVRLAIGFLMAYFLKDAYKKSHLKAAVSVQGDEYYINMMIAWYLATALIDHFDDVNELLLDGSLNDFVHRMTIRKAVESYRISEEKKKYLKTLRRQVHFLIAAEQ